MTKQEFLVLLDNHAEGPLGSMRWGTEGEMEWKVVVAENAEQAIKIAFGNQATLSCRREPNSVQEGDKDFPTHAATAFPLAGLSITNFRMTKKVETTYTMEIQ